MAVAIVSLGGKQFTVTPGKIIDVPHLNDEVGAKLNLTDLLHGRVVSGEVVEQTKGQKIRVIKFKNKTRYTRTIGHRSLITRVKIQQIEDK